MDELRGIINRHLATCLEHLPLLDSDLVEAKVYIRAVSHRTRCLNLQTVWNAELGHNSDAGQGHGTEAELIPLQIWGEGHGLVCFVFRRPAAA